jgi:ferredoxin
VIALLAAGNFFCFACPFTLPREIARRFRTATLHWPKHLRSKWLAAVLVVLFFWAYEAFDLWDRPAATAWLLIGYLAAALIVDALFRGASFCKYVCPIGQFQFVSSLVSPLEVKARLLDVCASCQTHDCLRGNEQQRGCEMELHMPRKAGNLDCTFCLDCVRACPHDNIGILPVAPGSALLHDARRAAIGRLSERRDLAALALVLVFGAFITAAAMTRPVLAWQTQLAVQFGSTAAWILGALFVCALVIVPLSLIGSSPAPWRVERSRLVFALVPLGTAMAAGHFLLHLLAAPPFEFNTRAILPFQVLLLDAGFLLTLYVGWRSLTSTAARRFLLPLWSAITVALYTFGIWIFLQPMAMRGMASMTLSR